MRPNIDISHTLGGRVKDWAEENDVDDLSEAYTTLLQAGLIAMQSGAAEGQSEDEETDAEAEYTDDALDCPDCGESFDSFDELRDHMQDTDPDHQI